MSALVVTTRLLLYKSRLIAAAFPAAVSAVRKNSDALSWLKLATVSNDPEFDNRRRNYGGKRDKKQATILDSGMAAPYRCSLIR